MRGQRKFGTTRRQFLALAATLPLFSSCSDENGGLHTDRRTEFSIGWSIYAGWTPWEYAERSGIVKRWADRYGLRIDFVQMGDYVSSLELFKSGDIDGVTATLGDGFSLAAAGGRDTTVVLLNDYSNGNDGILSKAVSSITELRGRRIHLQKGSVSHYLLARALAKNGLDQSDVTLVNLSSVDIVSAYSSTNVETIVAWNPELEIMRSSFGGKLLFDSSEIPGEIIDSLIVDTQVLRNQPDLAKALVGIWFETLRDLFSPDGTGAVARDIIANLSGLSPEMYDLVMQKTAFYLTPQQVLQAMTSQDTINGVDVRRKIRFEQGLAGGLSNIDEIGIQFESRILGNPENIKFRFDPKWVRMAIDGQL